jgi:hypothetical protein
MQWLVASGEWQAKSHPQLLTSPLLPLSNCYDRTLPFLDRDFLEFMLSVPSEQLIPYGQKTRPNYSRRPEPERIALLVSMIKQAGTSSCDGTFPVSLIYALIVSPAPAVPSTLCRFPLVVLQQTSQSLSTPPCSFVPSCFRPRREQDPVVLALVIALLVVMYEILQQCLPQRRFSKQDQPRQTFFFDRSHPAFRIRVQIRVISSFSLSFCFWLPLPLPNLLRQSQSWGR